MSEFQQEMEARLRSVQESLAEARLEGDDYSVQIFLGELDSLQRIAGENAVAC